MNDKYQITSDGTIFEVLSDGSIKKIGRISSEGRIDSFQNPTKPSSSSDASNVAEVLAWLFAIALIIVGFLCYDQNKEIDKLSNWNDQYKSQIQALEKDKQSLNSEVQEFKNHNSTLQSKINSLQFQNSTLQSQNENLQKNQVLRITTLKVGVTDSNNNIIVKFGNIIYSTLTKYLCLRGDINSDSRRKVKFYIKLYQNGTLCNSSSSPLGYTYTVDANLKSGNNTIDLGGWGSNDYGTWTKGDYKFEVWYKGFCLKEHSFTIF